MRLKVAVRDGATRISGLRQQGSLKALFPHGAGPALEAVFLNTAGGLTGGDRMRIAAEVGPGARVVISSQAAERAYRARGPVPARVQVTLDVAAGGRVDWLPQETILFDGAALERRLVVDLGTGARALIVESAILGREAMGETVRQLRLSDRWEIRQAGRIVFADALRFGGDAAALMAWPGIGSGARAWAGLIFAGPDTAGFLDPVRALLPSTAGASLVREGILFVRILAQDGFVLRQSLIPVIERLSGAALPKVWRL
ncbi:MAG: urease accessory protein UreD [Rhodobacterales bacterium]|nr:urease accessory protein UreD [Rhodobacterales bacterium]